MPIPHVCVDARMWNASGIGTYLQNLLPALAPQLRLSLVVGDDFAGDFAAERIVSRAAIYSLQEQWELPRLVPACDVFWSPHYNAPLLPVRAQRRVLTIHDVFHLAHSHSLSLAKRWYARGVMWVATRRADAVITVSEFSRGEILHHTAINPDRLWVIRNGVSAAFAQDSAISGAALRHKYRLPARYCLFVGNVKPHKNLRILLAAWQQSALKERELALVIVGKREGFITPDEELGHIISANPDLAAHIHFTGYVAQEELPALYRAAEMLLFPSLYEGFGLPPLEAMMSGCPCIVANTASLPEICGEAALYASPYHAADWASAILRLDTDATLRQSLIREGRARAAQFTWADAAQQHLEVLTQWSKHSV